MDITKMDEVSSIYQKEVENFISIISSNMPWDNMSKEVIMDIGCGYSKNCCEVIVKYFPNVGKIIGVDSDPAVIDKIRTENKHPNIEYHYADIQDRSTLLRWEGKITKIISAHCFHQVRNKEVAFQNAFRLLKAGCEASFLFCLESAVNSWWVELTSDPKWANIYKGPVCNFAEIYPKHCTIPYYKHMMKHVGFNIVHCCGEERVIPFVSDEICKENMIMTLEKFDIPNETKEELYKSAFEIYMKYNYRNDEGKPCCRSYNIVLVVQRPEEIPE